jgi:RNA polymerase sigma-70 factor (ECF subfamily)
VNPVRGRERVVRLLHGLFTKGKLAGVRVHRVVVNGQEGAMIFDAHDRLINVVALDIAEDVVLSVRSVVNPEKLGHLGPVSDLARLPVHARRDG